MEVDRYIDGGRVSVMVSNGGKRCIAWQTLHTQYCQLPWVKC